MPQLLHACSDLRKIISGAGAGTLTAQLLHACPNRGKIVRSAGSGHVVLHFLAARPGLRPLGIIQARGAVALFVEAIRLRNETGVRASRAGMSSPGKASKGSTLGKFL